jgi:SET domain-containing protein
MFQEPENLDEIFVSRKIRVKTSSLHGLGIFSVGTIEKHEIIEIAPVVLMHKDSLDTLEKMNDCRHIIQDYVFTWDDGMMGFPLGYGGLYNHSWEPNAFWKLGVDEPTLIFRASKIIVPGEEILIRYNPDWERVWFDTGQERHYDKEKPRFGEAMAKDWTDLRSAQATIDRTEGTAKDYLMNKK